MRISLFHNQGAGDSTSPSWIRELIETKAFHVKDGLGISVARAAGLVVAWITGRTSPVVERRALGQDTLIAMDRP